MHSMETQTQECPASNGMQHVNILPTTGYLHKYEWQAKKFVKCEHQTNEEGEKESRESSRESGREWLRVVQC